MIDRVAKISHKKAQARIKKTRALADICNRRDAIYSYFDAGKVSNPVIWFDPNIREMGEPIQQQFAPYREPLKSWISGLAG